eukprot:7187403-Pyramimonas_sp.AAC.1
MPTPSGLNLEREDLKEPLPAQWTKADLKDVTLYERYYSMPCVKVRAHLTYTLVPFKAKDGKKLGSDYTKIPVLDVNGIQINDSAIIVKTLAPIIYGRPLTDEVRKHTVLVWHLSLCMCADGLASGFSRALNAKRFAQGVALGAKINIWGNDCGREDLFRGCDRPEEVCAVCRIRQGLA